MTTCHGSSECPMVNRRDLRQDARPLRPHLDAIDPDAVGSYAADRWIRAAGPLSSAEARGVIAAYVKTLAIYAKTGGPPGCVDVVVDELETVVGWLFAPLISDPPDPMAALLDAPDGADEDRLALAVVLLAARGRIRLAWGDVIAVPEIAALTGLNQSHLARLARQGRLVRAGGPVVSKQHPPPIEGDSARELLRSYGVEGI